MILITQGLELQGIDCPALTGLIHERLKAMADSGGELYLLEPQGYRSKHSKNRSVLP